ncbi:GntR family transcriptional regulator [Stappia sp. ES.058]|uniref:GntR family transcriptional regulator n=1 Tax=Stappia sp. ES.058 TaxID=1881061 RepID=UPI00087D537B|nr:GntR family transcriptional regulator [Stappia sp. ES.058]SDU15309.1 transcriptional regulator, GntR family [Stappia sp. ES.058]
MARHGTMTKAAVSEIVSVLEQDIIFGRFLPKQRLYEDEFIVRFSTKRHIVRAAIHELERQGIVERQPNRGAAVRYFSRTEVAALYELRVILHEAAARRIRLPVDPDWFGELKAARDAHAEAVASRDLGLVFQTNTLFHRKLFEGTGNHYLSEAIETSNAKTHGIRSHGLGMPSLLDKAKAEHFAMVDAVKSGDLEKLARLCIDHMQPARAFYEEKYCSVM